jgi:hypothetical protein
MAIHHDLMNPRTNVRRPEFWRLHYFINDPQLQLILDPKPFTLYPSLTALDTTILDAVIHVPELSLFIPVPAVSPSIRMVDLHGLHGIQGIGSGKDDFRNGNYGGLSVPSEQAHARNYSGRSSESN